MNRSGSTFGIGNSHALASRLNPTGNGIKAKKKMEQEIKDMGDLDVQKEIEN